MHARVRDLLEGAVERGEIPGAVAVSGDAVGRRSALAVGVTGHWPGSAPVQESTLYDLASLTKVVATLPAVLKLVGAGELRLETRVGELFSNAGWFQTPSLGDVTVRELLTHSSGLGAWKPLFAWVSARETAVANVLQSALEHPAGSYVYSDLGFILLGAIVERLSKERLDTFVQREVFAPLGMTATRFGPLAAENVAATEDCGWRNLRLCGVVHDENAYVMDGVAGHAGLFGTAGDLATYAQAWLERDPRLAPADLLEEAVREQLAQNGERRGLGWMLKGENSSSGRHASRAAYGHTGFTGTSLWIDPGSHGPGGPHPEQSWFAVLLTNRVHPTRNHGQNVHALRAAFGEAVSQAFQKGPNI